MQCEEVDVEVAKSAAPALNELDSALHELGMLATYTEARNVYLEEIKLQNRRHFLKMLHRSNYVSNQIGFQLRPTAPHVRYKPYNLPKREERHRTKSENNEKELTSMVMAVLKETIIEPAEDLVTLKKAKSLESIMAESGKEIDLKQLTEVEAVSGYIEKLKVNE